MRDEASRSPGAAGITIRLVRTCPLQPMATAGARAVHPAAIRRVYLLLQVFSCSRSSPSELKRCPHTEHVCSAMPFTPHLTRHTGHDRTATRVRRCNLPYKWHNPLCEQVICHQQEAHGGLGSGVKLGRVQSRRQAVGVSKGEDESRTGSQIDLRPSDFRRAGLQDQGRGYLSDAQNPSQIDKETKRAGRRAGPHGPAMAVG